MGGPRAPESFLRSPPCPFRWIPTRPRVSRPLVGSRPVVLLSLLPIARQSIQQQAGHILPGLLGSLQSTSRPGSPCKCLWSFLPATGNREQSVWVWSCCSSSSAQAAWAFLPSGCEHSTARFRGVLLPHGGVGPFLGPNSWHASKYTCGQLTFLG